MNRKAVFAGRFYPGTKGALSKELQTLTRTDEERVKAIGIVSPHAGYVYSGAVAGEIFSRVNIPERVVILSPNHTGMGAYISVYDDGEWETPLGQVEVDWELCEIFMEKWDKIKSDFSAHMMEHSLEVQLPFIQHFRKDFKIVPITLSHLSVADCEKLGHIIAGGIEEYGKETLIVASSDMTHYESAKEAQIKDMLAIKEVEGLNPQGLLNVVREHGITMCGVIPTAVMLYAAKELGATKGVLVKYSNSGETSGDYDEVVGYAAMYVA